MRTIRAYLRKGAVYIDVDDDRSADDFHVQFNREVEPDGVMLAIIGPNWIGSARGGSARIMDADDPVRMELETASRRGIAILPVLVEGARMPKAEKLPPEVAYLTRYKAPQVDSKALEFGQQVQRLINRINSVLGPVAPEKNSAPGRNLPSTPPNHTSDDPAGTRHAVSATSIAAMMGEIASWFRRPVTVAALAMLGALGGLAYWKPLEGPKLDDGPPEVWANLPGRWPSPKIGYAGGAVRITISPTQLDSVSALRSVSFSRGRMAVSGDDGIIRLWSADTFRLEKAIVVKPAEPVLRPKPSAATPRPHGVHKIAFSAAGDVLYSAGLDDKVTVIDPATGDVMQRLSAEPGSKATLFHSLAAFPGKGDMTGRMRFVAAGADDGCFRIWDIDENEEKLRWRQFGGGNGDAFFAECQSAAKNGRREIGAIAYSPKAKDLYVVGNFDGTLGFVNGRYNTRAIPAHDEPIWEAVFSPTGDRVASASGDGVIRIWNFSDRIRIMELPKIGVPVWSLAWHEETLVSGDAKNTVWLWNTAKGLPKGAPFTGHEKNVVAVAFHPERKWIVSAGEDGFLKVWERDGESRDSLVTIISYKSENNDQYIIIHRDGTFTGPSIDVTRYLDMRYAEGPKKGDPLPNELKNGLYLSKEEFARKLAAGT
jgi:WD40 repeat protein